MQEVLIFFGVFFIPSITGKDSLIVKKSEAESHSPKLVFTEEKSLDYSNIPPLELIMNVRNFSESHISAKEKKKQKRERVRKRKEKGGKFSRQKNRSPKLFDDVARRILRNNEKTNLVRNSTIEILKSGLRILSTGENSTWNGSKTVSRVNETLLEKILSSAVSKQDVLISATGTYKLPVGFGMYEPKNPLLSNHTLVALSEGDFNKQPKQQTKKRNKSSNADYDYEYDLLSDFHVNKTNEFMKLYEGGDYEAVNVDKTVGLLLEEIVNTLKNLTGCSHGGCSEEEKMRFGDPCQKWLDCKQTLDRAFVKHNYTLPSCPCIYPSSIFYDEMIWDKKQNKYFRWRDASSEVERLDIYKPGAFYCIRSLLTQGSLSLSSQQCCYDRSLQLLTRGSGAGTMNFISPDVSRKLHYTVDILPWRLCKGDFTRYNIARNPNNGNNCPQNPNEQQYQLQVKLSKIY